MKQIIFLATLFNICFVQVKSQSISPSQTTEQCPGVNVTFTVSISGTGSSVFPKALNVNPIGVVVAVLTNH